MTDNEIIKALEDIIEYLDFTQIKSGENVLANVLDLINRQKAENEELQNLMVRYNGDFAKQEAEIERLKAELNRLYQEREQAKSDIEKALAELKELELSYEKDIQIARVEAIKEFAERLKEKTSYAKDVFDYTEKLVVDVEEIDNTLKEMESKNNE